MSENGRYHTLNIFWSFYKSTFFPVRMHTHTSLWWQSNRYRITTKLNGSVALSVSVGPKKSTQMILCVMTMRPVTVMLVDADCWWWPRRTMNHEKDGNSCVEGGAEPRGAKKKLERWSIVWIKRRHLNACPCNNTTIINIGCGGSSVPKPISIKYCMEIIPGITIIMIILCICTYICIQNRINLYLGSGPVVLHISL